MISIITLYFTIGAIFCADIYCNEKSCYDILEIERSAPISSNSKN